MSKDIRLKSTTYDRDIEIGQASDDDLYVTLIDKGGSSKRTISHLKPKCAIFLAKHILKIYKDHEDCEEDSDYDCS